MPSSFDSLPAAPPDATADAAGDRPRGLRLVPAQAAGCPDLSVVHRPGSPDVGCAVSATGSTSPAAALAGRHVLVMGPRRPDLLGHAERIRDLARHLAGSAASVTLLAGPPDGADRAQALYGGAHVVHLDHGDDRCRSGDRTALARTAYEATRMVSAATGAVPAPPDLLIAASPGLGAVMAATRLARRHQVPLVVLVHDLLAAGRGAGPVGSTLERYALTAADLVGVLCDSFCELVAGYGVPEDRIVRLPTWTDLATDGAPPAQRRAARLALGWPARGIQVLTADVGRGQDVATVVEAARLLEEAAGDHPEPPDLRFVVVGDGTRRRRLGQQLSQRARLTRGSGRGPGGVHRVDDLGPDRVGLALAAADLLVISQNAHDPHGCGTAGMLLARYLAAGRPVVLAADRGTPMARTVAATSGAGVVVPPGDPQALAQAVARLASRAALRTLMAERAAHYARTALDRAAAMTAIDALVERALTPS